jgi:hypothetical protein
MFQQAVILCSDALMHATYGVTKQLDLMQAQGYFGAGPTYPERPGDLVTALNAYQDRSIADGMELAETPYAIVSIDDPYQEQVQRPDWDSVWRQSNAMSLAIRLVSGDADGELANRHADFLTRATVWCLREWMHEDTPRSHRRLQGIQLFDTQRLLYGPVEEKYGPATVTAAVVLTIRARDFAD